MIFQVNMTVVIESGTCYRPICPASSPKPPLKVGVEILVTERQKDAGYECCESIQLWPIFHGIALYDWNANKYGHTNYGKPQVRRMGICRMPDSAGIEALEAR